MTPNVNCLVVEHEKRLEDALLSIKVDSVSCENEFIVRHEFRCLLKSPYETPVLIQIFILFLINFWYLFEIIFLLDEVIHFMSP